MILYNFDACNVMQIFDTYISWAVCDNTEGLILEKLKLFHMNFSRVDDANASIFKELLSMNY